jgi:chlorinating enzyme
MHDIVTSPAILDQVEDIIGPNILVWNCQFWIKEQDSLAYVGWHQDSNYWGLEPYELVTAWVAFSDVTMSSGPMQFIPGTHEQHESNFPHDDTYQANNLLSRGQEIKFRTKIQPSDVASAVLRPGEFTLFDIKLVHGSPPNEGDGRRVGMAIRYMPTTTRTVRESGDTAMLVRGVDTYGNFIPDLPPKAHATDQEARAAADFSNKLKGSATLVDADMARFKQVQAERAALNNPPHIMKSRI